MKIVDLTMTIKSKSPVYPTYISPVVHTWTSHREHGFYSNLLILNDHTLTHVDCPAHMIENGATVDSLPLDRFMGLATAIDLAYLKPRESISRDLLLKELEKLGVESFKNMIILMRTGFDEKIGSSEWFNHPGLDKSAAKLLVEMNVKAVGVDAPSIDHEPYHAHKILLQNNVVIYENLTNLKEVVNKVFKFYGFPLKIYKGSGSPVRAVAIIE